MRTWFSKLARSMRSSDKTAAVRTAAAVMPVENLEDRRLFSGNLDLSYGINANSIRAENYPKVLAMLRDTGTKSVRLWLNLDNYSTRSETGIFKYVRRFSNDGIDTTVTVDPPKHAGSYNAVKNSFAWLADELGDSVDRWEVGNEIDIEFPSLKGYVNDTLKPAAEGLHSRGEKVVSGSVSWNPDDVRTMADAGMLNYVDMVGYHPYRNNVKQLKEAVAEVKDIANGKPLVATEWNARGNEHDANKWNDEIKAFWPTIRDNFYAAYYFASIKNNSMAGPAGVMTSSGSVNGEFYSTYKSLRFNTGGDGDVVSSPVTPSQPDTGSTPSSNSKPSVTGFAIYDAVTNKVLKGYENVTGNKTIKLSDLKNKKIQIRAVASSKTSSIKFGFTGRTTHIENTAPWTVFSNSKNQATYWSAVKGSFNLSAIGYTADNGKGVAGAKKSITLKFV